MRNTREQFRQELTESQEKACQGINDQETSLRRRLREMVVDDAIKIFP
jgi:F0F1-type ATP synthase membrane subunit b/b'